MQFEKFVYGGIFIYITEHKQGKEILRESLKKFRYFFKTLQGGFWTVDKDSYTTFINLCTAEMLRPTIKEKKGKHLSMRVLKKMEMKVNYFILPKKRNELFMIEG